MELFQPVDVWHLKKDGVEKKLVIAAEESVSVSDSGTKAGPSTSSMPTPSHQKTFSKDVIPDYRLYTLKHQSKSRHQQFPVIGIAEVKRMEDFNDRAVCQTIGYHIASLYDNTDDGYPTHPPLFILICQNKLRFIFFPFVTDSRVTDVKPCIDAVVTTGISVFIEGGVVDKSWFCFYIERLYVYIFCRLNAVN